MNLAMLIRQYKPVDRPANDACGIQGRYGGAERAAHHAKWSASATHSSDHFRAYSSTINFALLSELLVYCLITHFHNGEYILKRPHLLSGIFVLFRTTPSVTPGGAISLFSRALLHRLLQLAPRMVTTRSPISLLLTSAARRSSSLRYVFPKLH